MRLQAILALLCALTAAAAYHFTPHLMLADLQPVKLETMIPEQFGEWRMVPVSGEIISSPEQDKFIKSIYSQVLTRTYMDNSGHHIMLSIAYTRDQSDNSGTQSHKPEICYPAQGFQIRSNNRSALMTDSGSIPVRRLLAVQGERVEPITYWTTVGNTVVLNGIETKMAQISYGAKGFISDGLIFRVSTIGDNPEKEFLTQQNFTVNLVRALDAKSKAKIFGL